MIMDGATTGKTSRLLHRVQVRPTTEMTTMRDGATTRTGIHPLRDTQELQTTRTLTMGAGVGIQTEIHPHLHTQEAPTTVISTTLGEVDVWTQIHLLQRPMASSVLLLAVAITTFKSKTVCTAMTAYKLCFIRRGKTSQKTSNARIQPAVEGRHLTGWDTVRRVTSCAT